MLIDWHDHRLVSDARCPVCGHIAGTPRDFSYRAESLRAIAGGDEVAMLRCPACDVRYCDPLVSVDYADADERGAKFYLESGAGIDVMLEALALADSRPVRRYLEIGCSFGFILEYARRILGWDVRGFDPGALARLGRETLKLPIDNSFFQSGSGFDGWADLVFCSEVIEHIPDPAPFLDLLSSALRPDGQLILTTPNGDVLTEQADPAVLSAILSPGHHIVLYNPVSITAVLKRHGFTEVRVEENGFQLRVAASRGPMHGRSDWFDRGRYRDYLRALATDFSAESPLGAGVAYRLFKEQVNGGDHDGARATYGILRDAYRLRYGFDLDDPAAIPVPSERAGFDKLGQDWPFNLTGLLYFHGVLEWLGNRQPARAAANFRASARLGRATRRILRTAGVDDLEMADLGRQAGLARLSALAQYDPDGAVEALQAFVETLPDDDGETARAALSLEARRRLFLDLVNLGHLTAALGVLAVGELALAEPPPSVELPLAFALALVLLNRGGDFAGAARLFGHVADAPQTPPSRRREAVLFRLSALARSEPEHAADLFLALDPADPVHAEAQRRLFVDLVNLGQVAAAERVLGTGDLGLADPPSPGELPVVYALALYLMNHKSDFAAAASWFAKVAAAARGNEAQDAYFWTARFHHGIARRHGGEPETIDVIVEMLAPAADLPPVPAALLGRIGELKAEEKVTGGTQA